jgi:hypothetical protein
MVNTLDSDFDEEAALEALRDNLAAPHPHDIIKREHERELRGYPRNVALEKWGPELEEMIMRDLRAKASTKPRGQVLPLVRQKKNQAE